MVGIKLAFASAALLSGSALAQAPEENPFDAPLVVTQPFVTLRHLADVNDDPFPDFVGWGRTHYTATNTDRAVVYGIANNGQGRPGSVVWSFIVAGFEGVHHATITASGDLNGDGLTDAAATCDGRMAAVAHYDSTTHHYAYWTLSRELSDIELVDLDGDNCGELIYREVAGVVKIHKNNTFQLNPTPVVSWDAGPISGKLRVGDLSGDGVPDLLFVLADRLRIQELNADGSLGGVTEFPTSAAWSMAKPVIADLDGDGDQDAVVFDGFVPSGVYTVLRTLGPRNWVLESPRAGGPATELADIDSDGDLDGICCGGGGGGGSVTWMEHDQPSVFHLCHNDGTGNFSGSFQMWGLGSQHIAGAADVDADGDADLVAGRVIYYANGPIKAPIHPGLAQLPLGTGGLCDVDGDGDLDAALGPVSLHVQDGAGHFAPSLPDLPTPGPGSAFAGPGYAGDWDGDGDSDLIVARFDGGTFSHMNLMANRGAGKFDDAGACAPVGLHFSFTGETNLDPAFSLVADLQDDGDLDLITRSRIPDTAAARAWLNNGQAYFTPAETFDAGFAQFVPAAVGELTGNDGIPDVVTLAPYEGLSPSVRVYKGLADGSFELWASGWLGGAGVDGRRDSVALLDFDADGDLDIAMAATNVTSPFIMDNVNGVSFIGYIPAEFAEMKLVGTGERHVLAGDFDANGIVDLAAWPAKSALSAAHVLLRKPAPLVGRVITHVMQPRAFHDIDGDGDQEAVVVTPIGASAWIANQRHSGIQAGSRQQYGEGSLGAGGLKPILGAHGPFRLGETAQLRVRGGLGSTNGLIAVGSQMSALPDTPFQGMTMHVSPIERRLPFTLSSGGEGEGHFTLEFTVSAPLAGLTVYYQAYIYDYQTSFGLSCSNGLRVSYGL